MGRNPERRKWEYRALYKKTETRDVDSIESALNDLGDKGWELVAVFGQTDSEMGKTKPHLYLFKRQMRIKICPECGTENEQDAEYCIECGGELPS